MNQTKLRNFNTTQIFLKQTIFNVKISIQHFTNACIPVQLTPAVIPVEHVEDSLRITHCCMFISDSTQFMSTDCGDKTAMLSGIPPVEIEQNFP